MRDIERGGDIGRQGDGERERGDIGREGDGERGGEYREGGRWRERYREGEREMEGERERGVREGGREKDKCKRERKIVNRRERERER